MDGYLRQGKSKAEFAEVIGIPASQLSQLTTDKASRNIGDIIARRVEVNLALSSGWLDVPHDPVAVGEQHHTNETLSNYHLQNISHKDTDLPYRIEQLDVEFSCGGGRLNNDYPDIVRSIEINSEYAKRMFGGRKSASLKLATAVGDSMLGTIDPGELVVLDITVNHFISDGIYAFTYGDGMHIKRLQLLKDKFIVISDNKIYERWEIDSENEPKFHIHGFIVGKWRMDYSRLG